MGIVLKRRDNAPLLKMAYGAAIDRLLNHQDVPGAVAAVKKVVRDLVEGRMKLSQLTITKSLRAEYKTTPPAHKVLANRIAERDPGNAPASGERIGYVYILPHGAQALSNLQGDRVETPAFIVKNNLKPDVEYYINHQLYNPLAQLFGIMVEKMPGFIPPSSWSEGEKRIAQREAIAADLLFKEGLLEGRQQTRKCLIASNNNAKSKFIQMMGGGKAPAPIFRKPPVDETMAKAEAEAFGGGSKALANPMIKKQQTIMSAFAMDTACFMDERLVKEMKSARKSRTSTAAAAAAAAASGPKVATKESKK